MFSRDHHSIHDLGEWEPAVDPASKDRFRPQFAVYELARLWLDDAGLTALRTVLDLVPATSGFVPERGIADARTTFDQYGGPQNHDLLLIGDAAGGRTVVGIEGRVNESFGQTLAEYDEAASRKSVRGEATNAAERLDNLTQALGGWILPDDDLDQRRSLRYQLFTALAGTIAAAGDESAKQAVFCVHELQTPASETAARARTSKDMHEFLRLLFPAAETVSADGGWVGGPVHVVRRTLRLPSDVAAYVAQLTTPSLS